VLRFSAPLVETASSKEPPPDRLAVRWQRRPMLAAVLRVVILGTPLAASIAAGVVASRQFRPHSLESLLLWLGWTATASLVVLWLVDIVVRRLLPLHRMLHLCLAFPDRAPSRLRIAARAARARRPEALLARVDLAPSASEAAEHIVTLLAALATHDRRTRGHCERVCAFTGLLAAEMDLSADDRDRLLWVALIHDIGKLHVPSRILNKPDRPTVGEWNRLKEHPVRGAEMIGPLEAWLGPWARAVREHHEHYDGTGYPTGLRGEQISLAARVVAVCDAFEVMTAPRPYRRAVDAHAARAELARFAGRQFDPVVVRHFLAVGLPELRRVMGPLSWLGTLPFISRWPRLESAASSATQAMTATAAASTASILVLGSHAGAVAEAAAVPASAAGTGFSAVHASTPAGVAAKRLLSLTVKRRATQSPAEQPSGTPVAAAGERTRPGRVERTSSGRTSTRRRSSGRTGARDTSAGRRPAAADPSPAHSAGHHSAGHSNKPSGGHHGKPSGGHR
jgi:hypothetical protein